MAHGRPAGPGRHCQRVQGPEQGRTQPWPGPLGLGKVWALSALGGQQGWCVARQRPSTLRSRGTLWLWEEGWGAVEGSLGWRFCQEQFGTGERERERERKRKTQSRHPGQAAAANVGIAESGSGACLDPPAFVAALYRPGALYGLCETYRTVLSQELGPEQVLVPALLQAPGSGLPVWSSIEMVIAATNHPLHLCHQGQRALIPSQCRTGPSSL